jgi:hypothetical protein
VHAELERQAIVEYPKEGTVFSRAAIARWPAKGPDDVHPRGGGKRRQQANERLTCRLLRARRERPRGCRATERSATERG